MKFLLLLIPSIALAGGPKYGHEPSKLDDEVSNIYYDIRAVAASVSSVTAIVSSINSDYVSSNVNSNTAFPTSTQFGDLTSISLTTGTWLVSTVARCNSLTSTTMTGFEIGISVTSGNSSTGLTATENYVPLTFPTGNHGANDAFMSISIPMWRLSVAATTPVYLKYSATYTGTAPAANGSIRAIRIRQ